MAKNEAKIRFTAETGDFNNAIKKSKDEMSLLNAQMKLNETQMKATGTSVEGLEQKQKLLTDKQKEQQGVVEALNGKLQKAVECFGENSAEATKLKTQLTNAQIAEEKIAQEISKCNSELEEQRKVADKAEDDVEDLGDSLKDAGDDAEDAGDGFTICKGMLADLASSGVQAAIGGLKNLASSFLSLAEDTRETRTAFAGVQQAFETVGADAEIASERTVDAMYGLTGILGDADRAAESASFLAKYSKDSEDLQKNIKVLTGVFSEYGVSIPTEGLAEGIAATSEMGVVQGVLADALEWQGVNLDDYNEKLGKMSSAEERAAYIQDTLLGIYGESADAYRENNASLIEANETQLRYNDNLASLGEKAEPITTGLKNGFSDILMAVRSLVDDVDFNAIGQSIADTFGKFAFEGIPAIIEGLKQTVTWINENKTLLAVLATAIGVVVTGIGLYNTVVAIKAAMDAAQVTTIWGLVAAHIAQAAAAIAAVAPYILIVAAIAAVIAIIVLCIKYWDEIVIAVKKAWEWIKATLATVGQWIYDNVIIPVVEFFKGLWESIKGVFSGVGTWVYENIIAPVVTFITGLWQSFVDTFDMIIGPWIEIAKRAAAWVYDNIITPVVQYFTELWTNVKEIFTSLWGDVKAIFTNLWKDIKGVWAVVSGWFGTKVIDPVKNKFTSIWDSIKNGAKNAWSGIKNTFSKVASFFGDIFGKAWTKVKNIFSTGGKIFDGIKDGIASAFKSIVNKIISGINRVVSIPFNAINSALGKIRNVEILGVSPFTWIPTISVPKIPMLAEGGILTKPTLNIAGEAGPEAIIPIDKLQSFMYGALERTMQRDNVSQLVAAVEDLANRPIELSINGQKFAVATAADTDTVNGGRMVLRQRGLAL